MPCVQRVGVETSNLGRRSLTWSPKNRLAERPPKKRSFHKELVLNRWVLGFFQGGTLAALKMRLRNNAD